MQVIPAIDILGGKCVRLFKGDYSNKKVYDSDPASVAFNWQSQGAILIHVVDLDGAREGRSVNTDAIASILASVDTPIQVGGGIRSFESAARLLEAGVERVVLGTSAVADPDLLKELVDSFTPRRVVVGIDAKAGKVATTGWTRIQSIDAIELAKTVKAAGVVNVVYTDIDRDGTMTGPNLEYTRALAVGSGLNVIASGGVACLDDLLSVKALEADGVTGVIVGKALYEGAFSLEDAIRALA